MMRDALLVLVLGFIKAHREMVTSLREFGRASPANKTLPEATEVLHILVSCFGYCRLCYPEKVKSYTVLFAVQSLFINIHTKDRQV